MNKGKKIIINKGKKIKIDESLYLGLKLKKWRNI